MESRSITELLGDVCTANEAMWISRECNIMTVVQDFKIPLSHSATTATPVVASDAKTAM